MTTTTIRKLEPATIVSSAAFTAFVLKQLRSAELRAELYVTQIKTARTALADGLVTPEIAILILSETGIGVVSS